MKVVMKEKDIEDYLVKQVREKLDGIAYKFTSPGRRSVPDRMCVVYGEVFFVECKAPGKVATPAQLREHAKLKALGQWVYVTSSKYVVDKIIKFWEERLDEK